MATQGTTTVDFGAFPGASDASVAVTGQTSITGTSLVEAWLYPTATADHTADEHWVETIACCAGNVSAGVGFTIYAWNTNQISEPVLPTVHNTSITTAGTAIAIKTAQPAGNGNVVLSVIVGGDASKVTAIGGGGKGTRLYGTWTVAWVYN
jgi:hypothetical protein